MSADEEYALLQSKFFAYFFFLGISILQYAFCLVTTDLGFIEKKDLGLLVVQSDWVCYIAVGTKLNPLLRSEIGFLLVCNLTSR